MTDLIPAQRPETDADLRIRCCNGLMDDCRKLRAHCSILEEQVSDLERRPPVGAGLGRRMKYLFMGR